LLGQMYENGQGCEKDYEKALEYYELSAPEFFKAKQALIELKRILEEQEAVICQEEVARARVFKL